MKMIGMMMCMVKTMMMRCLLFKQLKELGPSTPSPPSDFQTPQYIPNYEKIYLTKEEVEYVDQSVKNGTQVKPVHISRKLDKSVDVSVNLYKEALTQDIGQIPG